MLQHDIGLRRLTTLYRLHPVRRLSNHLVPGQIAQHARETIARQLFVVDYEHLHRCAASFVESSDPSETRHG